MQTNEKGFTLMELLVVLGIFSMVVTAASDIFLLTSRSQRKIFGLERTQSDARFTMEAIAREIRTGAIDYAYYAGGSGLTVPSSELALIDSTNAPIRFSLSDVSNESACADVTSRPCLLVTVGGTSTAITPKGVAVRTLAFYVSPTADPTSFDPSNGTYAANEQPRVTIVLSLESTSEKADERSTINLQTTIANRRYRR